MVKNYLQITLRSLLRQKGYTLITVGGLAVGMTSCLLIFLYVQNETSYDRHHDRADRIFRVVQEQRFSGMVQQVAVVALPVGPALAHQLPEVEDVVRLRPQSGLITCGEKQFNDQHFLYADPSLFSVFSFPLMWGDAATALVQPNSIVLTRAMAEKCFGKENPVGKIVKMDNLIDCRVTGVVQNPPATSHFHFDCLLSFSTLLEKSPWNNASDTWGMNSFHTYILLRKNASATTVGRKLYDFTVRNRGAEDAKYISYYLQPLTDIHLHSDMVAELEPNGSMSAVYILSSIACFLLMMACINYMNLATARAATRRKEIGIRKVLGAFRFQIMGQFLIESILITFVALFCALAFGELFLPLFNQFIHKHLSLNSILTPMGVVLLTGTGVIIALFAGAYPALYLSHFRPSVVLKGMQAGRQRSLMRQVLVIIQFTISITLIIGTVIAYRQLQYMRTKPLGFSRDHVLVVKLHSRELQKKVDILKQEFARHPQVRAVASASMLIGWGLPQCNLALEDDPSGKQWIVSLLAVDQQFIPAMGMRIIAGRAFSPEFATDTARGFVVNESAVRSFGWSSPEAALGRVLTYGSRTGPIIGVVRDFHFLSLHQPIEPLAMYCALPELLPITLRLHADASPYVRADLEKIWRKVVPDWPFDAAFLDEDLELLYRSDALLGQVFGLFTLLSLFIAMLGLFGLGAYMAQQRTREIGIRKVLGATAVHILILLSKDFTRLVLIAFVLAVPVAWLGMHRWLQDFAYRMSINGYIFLFAGIAALCAAWLTTTYHAMKAARINPAEVLHYE